MTAIIDDRRRVLLPKTATPGTVVDVVEGPDGWTLTVMKPVETEAVTVKMVRRNGRLCFPSNLKLAKGAAAEAVKQERNDRSAKTSK